MAVISEAKDSNGMGILDSLDDPESLCTVDVWLIPQCRTDYGNGEVRFPNRGTGDVGRFICQQAIKRGARPVATNNLSSIGGPWRYLENQDGVVLRIPSDRFSEVESFLRQAFGPPTQKPLKGEGISLSYSAGTNGLEIMVFSRPEYAQVHVLRPRPIGKVSKNVPLKPERSK